MTRPLAAVVCLTVAAGGSRRSSVAVHDHGAWFRDPGRGEVSPVAPALRQAIARPRRMRETH